MNPKFRDADDTGDDFDFYDDNYPFVPVAGAGGAVLEYMED